MTTHFSSLKPHKQASVSGPGSGAFAFRVEAQRHPSNLHDRPPRAPPRLSSPGPCLFPSGRAPFCPPFSLSLSPARHSANPRPRLPNRAEPSSRAAASARAGASRHGCYKSLRQHPGPGRRSFGSWRRRPLRRARAQQGVHRRRAQGRVPAARHGTFFPFEFQSNQCCSSPLLPTNRSESRILR